MCISALRFHLSPFRSIVRTESGCWHACSVHKVGLGVGLPSVADNGGVLHVLAPHLHLAVFLHHGLGRIEGSVLAGYLEGEEFFTIVGRAQAIGMVEGNVGGTLLELCLAEEGS